MRHLQSGNEKTPIVTKKVLKLDYPSIIKTCIMLLH